ncbi:MAG TPA: hypothetical protein VGL95_04565 [Acetobacteraceae bacterium]
MALIRKACSARGFSEPRSFPDQTAGTAKPPVPDICAGSQSRYQPEVADDLETRDGSCVSKILQIMTVSDAALDNLSIQGEPPDSTGTVAGPHFAAPISVANEQTP